MEHCQKASFVFFSFFLALFLVFSTSTSAFNITKLLEKQSDFSNFNQLLSETKLADQINSRSTITVLAVDNGGASGLSSRPSDVQKKILSLHVILDYYDQDKLKKIFKSNKSATLTTMFQTTGEARNEQGFIKVSVNNNQISFGSAAKGGNNGNNVNLVKSVVSQPYNISVLQVGSIIDIPDIESSGPASAPKSAKAPSPSKSKKEDSDDGASSPSDDEDSSSQKDSSPKKAPSPSKSDKGHDKSSPPVSADSETDNTKAPTPSAPAPSAASRTREIMGVSAGVVIMVASLLIF